MGLLGINIFYYLGDVSEYTGEIINPILKLVGYETSGVIKQTVKTSGVGADTAIDTTAKTLKGTISLTEDVIDETLPSSNSTMARSKVNTTAQQNLNTRPVVDRDVKPYNDDSDNTLTIDSLSTKSSSSSTIGYCYIGEDRGHRSCVSINDENMCMSGEIFPSRDVCVNPNLRD